MLFRKEIILPCARPTGWQQITTIEIGITQKRSYFYHNYYVYRFIIYHFYEKTHTHMNHPRAKSLPLLFSGQIYHLFTSYLYLLALDWP